MKRREFIKIFAGSVAVASPLAARAEQMHRVGMLVNGPETDALMMARVAAFRNTLQELGWTSENLRIDIRSDLLWAGFPRSVPPRGRLC
jgi:hypothetical protein